MSTATHHLGVSHCAHNIIPIRTFTMGAKGRAITSSPRWRSKFAATQSCYSSATCGLSVLSLTQIQTQATKITKTLTTITISLLSTITLYCQPQLDTIVICNRLYIEVKNHNQVELNYIGCYGNKSTIYKKADSLKNLTTKDTFINYFGDSSSVLRYYSYLEILKQNDELAFKRLINIINDTSKVDYEFAGSNRGTLKFNELISIEYLGYIKAKYFYGGSLTHHGKSYQFDKKNLKIWKAKRNLLYDLIDKNNLDRNKIENYSR